MCVTVCMPLGPCIFQSSLTIQVFIHLTNHLSQSIQTDRRLVRHLYNHSLAFIGLAYRSRPFVLTGSWSNITPGKMVSTGDYYGCLGKSSTDTTSILDIIIKITLLWSLSKALCHRRISFLPLVFPQIDRVFYSLPTCIRSDRMK